MQLLLNLLFVVVIIQAIYYLLILNRKLEKKKSTETPDLQPTSVIIAARNESKNLSQFLPKILNQNYFEFEVIVVNDGSMDNSEEILEALSKQYKNLKVINLAPNKDSGNKKNALTIGINNSQYKQLLFTDADCYPSSPNWILKMSQQFSEKTDIVLGYGAYEKIENSYLNKLIRYETLLTAILYFSHAKLGAPYMGVGRNLAYKRQIFKENSGFENHKNINSGDDDLFVNQVARNNNTSSCISSEAFTISKSKKTYQDWLLQKRRHITTSSRYKPIHKLSLGVFHFSQILFYLLIIILFLNGFEWFYVFLLFLIRFVFQYSIYYYHAKNLRENDLLIYLPLLDFSLVITQLYIFIHNNIKPPTRWS